MEAKESQYDAHFRDIEEYGSVALGPMASARWREDPKGLGFKIARYKTVAKLFSGQDRVLEIGCADGWLSKIVARDVNHFIASDFDPIWKPFVNNALSEEKSFKGFEVFNPIVSAREPRVDSIFALDVLEHINPDDEKAFLTNVCKSVDNSGLVILGVPTLESQTYASQGSRDGHVNCKSGDALRETLLEHFKQVLILGMNDETLHTGFLPMSHYIFAICFGPVMER